MAPRPLLTVLLIAHDEEARLPAFFRALRDLAVPHLTLVIEHGSSDATATLARRSGARVLDLPWEGFARTKNRGIQACRTEWVLSLDADENPSPRLCRSIEAALNSPAAPAYSVNRLNYFLGKPLRHGGWHPDWQLRLFRRGSALFNTRLVHEGLEMLPGQDRPGKLEGELLHFSYPNLHSYLERLDRYTSLQARELMGRKGARPWWAALRMLSDPPLTFLKMVFLKAGFLDGREGWLVSALSASSTFWKYAKWWHLSWTSRGGNAGIPWVLQGKSGRTSRDG
jgi:hypothetical protein